MTAFDTAWDLLKTSIGDIDSDENDDEFIDDENFNKPAVRAIEEILSIFGLEGKIDMCYSCGLEGTLDNFTQRNQFGRLERKCPQCGSYEIHGKNAYGGK
jgi:hypothetical protein